MRQVIRYLLLCYAPILLGQGAVDRFLEPSDTLNISRQKAVWIAQGTLMAGTLVTLSKAWYEDYNQSNFHSYDDNAQWLQLDKAGHVFSTYQLARMSSETLQWSGMSKKNSIWGGMLTGLSFMTTIEVFDGFSSEWGFSYGDMLANIMGAGLYAGQEGLWGEQRIVVKYSFHTTPYASRRPQTLGVSFQEQMLKDYNGQTYWLSANINSFFCKEWIPKWVNIALGYGAAGMITGKELFVNTIFLPENERYRKFYLSLDVDLTKINTRSNFLKTLFSIINTIKIPAPTIEYNSREGLLFHVFYF